MVRRRLVPGLPGAPPAALALSAALALFAPVAAAAEVKPGVELTLLDTLTHLDGLEVGLAGSALAKVFLDAAPSDSVRGQLAVEARVGATTEAEVSRAYVRVRTPGWRATQGLAPIAWGQGFFYNAADVIFGPVGSTADLTADSLRDLAVWQTTLFVPLGPFSFVEAAALAPGLDLATGEIPSVGEAAGGARFLGRVGGTQVEAGYLYRGSDGTHNPFVSLHGNLFFDVYLAASAALPQEGVAPDDLPGTLLVSGGLYHVMRLPDDTDLRVRLEALVRPGGRWRPGDPGSEYGILVYPEAIWNIGPKLSLLSRNFVSPIDVSALCALGVYWRIQTGLTLLAFGSVQLGDTGDTYGWGRSGDLAVTTGFRYAY
jgi:hypothetical protein